MAAYRSGKLAGYIFLSTDMVHITSYSGEPIGTLEAINPHGTIIGARVVSCNDPIFLIGLPISDLYRYVR
ncbi:MAG: 4Fe-4S binding protein, partial [Firmicutes bacterium]|nr:4Fe-4S binding protein [Bacillota bacterium]